jgi:cell fate regulator YaaT (PSP1 superfamily)
MDKKIDSPFWLDDDSWENFGSGWDELEKSFVAGGDEEKVEIPEKKPPCATCVKKVIDPELAKIEHTLNLVEVEFKGSRRAFYINEQNLQLTIGSYVIVEADRGIDCGKVYLTGEPVHIKRKYRGIVGQPMRKIIRKATYGDLKRLRKNREDEEKAFHVFKERVKLFNLDMKLVDVEFQFDRNRITFYFTAEGRVDFRAFVRDLAKIYKTRIELWQIGVRDEAKRVGGIGSCGRELCCSTWLETFKRVTLQHARIQNLPLNPVKLSGQCGRLKCCLLYEIENYVSILINFPPIDYEVKTERGSGKIEKFDIFKNCVYVHYGGDIWEKFTLEEIRRYIPPEAFDQSRQMLEQLL